MRSMAAPLPVLHLLAPRSRGSSSAIHHRNSPPERAGGLRTIGGTSPARASNSACEQVISRFLTRMPTKFDPAGGPAIVQGVIVDVDDGSGRAEAIRRVQERVDR